MKVPHRAWLEVNLDALSHNAQLVKKLVAPTCQSMAVVKANAYGLGVARVVEELEGQVDAFGVANLAEAIEILEVGVSKPVFLLGAALEEERPEVVKRGLIPVVSSVQEAQAYAQQAKEVRKKLVAHLSLDTGMGRMGFLPEDWNVHNIQALKAMPEIDWQGLGTHLPSADEDLASSRRQLKEFAKLVNVAREVGLNFSQVHVANSAGIWNLREELKELLGEGERECGMVRPGLMLYGASSVKELGAALQQVVSFKSRLIQIRELPKGSRVSYGGQYQVTQHRQRVGTVGVGYGDGYPRSANAQGEAKVMIAGQSCAVLGRVTMDQLMVDLQQLPEVQLGEEVLLFGKSRGLDDGSSEQELGVERLAQWAGTIPWEVFTGITPRVERVYRAAKNCI